MRAIITIIFLVIGLKGFSQVDSALIYQKADKIIRYIEKQEIDSLLLNSTDSVRCIICEETGIKQYIPIKIFLKTKLNEIFDAQLLSKLKMADKMIVQQNAPYPSFIVYYKIYRKDELTSGHEGVDFGIWLTGNDELKFTAIDTVP